MDTHLNDIVFSNRLLNASKTHPTMDTQRESSGSEDEFELVFNRKRAHKSSENPNPKFLKIDNLPVTIDVPHNIILPTQSQPPTQQEDMDTIIPPTRTNTQIPTSNRFAPLAELSQEEARAPDTQPPRPPPLFLSASTNFSELLGHLISEIGREKFKYTSTLKYIKVLCSDVEAYRRMSVLLKRKDIEFHSYQLAEKRALRVVVRNLHSSTEPELIKADLEGKGFKVRQVVNVLARNKNPLPLFYVDLEPEKSNERIYSITGIMNCIVRVEPFRPRNRIPQCTNCQDYNHTSAYCLHKPRCVRCRGDHRYEDCPVPRELPPECVNCGGNHTANYRGCEVHMHLMKKRAPRAVPPQPSITSNSPQFPQSSRLPRHDQLQRHEPPQGPLATAHFPPLKPSRLSQHAELQNHEPRQAHSRQSYSGAVANSGNPSEWVTLISTTMNTLLQPLLQLITQISNTMSQIQSFLMRDGK